MPLLINLSRNTIVSPCTRSSILAVFVASMARPLAPAILRMSLPPGCPSEATSKLCFCM